MRQSRCCLLFLLALAAPLPLVAQGTPTDTLPASVVQRFVDAANARDAKAMAAQVSPTATFEFFPTGRALIAGRDSIEVYYTRLLSTLPADFKISVNPRTVEGQMVIDQEHFAGMPPERSQSTWIYLVRRGLIERAWLVVGTPPRAQ